MLLKLALFEKFLHFMIHITSPDERLMNLLWPFRCMGVSHVCGPCADILEARRPPYAFLRKADERAKVFIDMTAARYFSFWYTEKKVELTRTPKSTPVSRVFVGVGNNTGMGALVGEACTQAVSGSLQAPLP